MTTRELNILPQFLKNNWEETKQHFIKWWNRDGFVLGQWESGIAAHRVSAESESIAQFYTDPNWRADHNLAMLSHRVYPADILPIADTDIGPGSLSLYLGCQAGFADHTVWFHPCMTDLKAHPPLVFSTEQKWWKTHYAILQQCLKASRGRFLVPCPDLVEGLDILASIRGTQELLIEMLENPELIHTRLEQISTAWSVAYESIYDLIKDQDGGCSYGAFRLWAPGRVAKIQCDCSAMISPATFREFVFPYLNQQCNCLDYSMYHLDGTQCMCHLEQVLAIENLTAVEWTPQTGIPDGGDPVWYGVYKKILDAKKAVQVVGIKPHEIIPLVDEIGAKGIYLLTQFSSEQQAELLYRQLETYI